MPLKIIQRSDVYKRDRACAIRSIKESIDHTTNSVTLHILHNVLRSLQGRRAEDDDELCYVHDTSNDCSYIAWSMTPSTPVSLVFDGMNAGNAIALLHTHEIQNYSEHRLFAENLLAKIHAH